MKKKFILLLTVALLVSFADQLPGREMNRHTRVKPVNTGNTRVHFINPADEQGKFERYLKARDGKAQKHLRQKAAAGTANNDKPLAASIELVQDSDHWQSDSYGNLVWTGACYNGGTSGATLLMVTIDVYDKYGIYLGSASNYVWGGSNVQLYPSGEFTNAIRPTESGFFRIWTDISYDNADHLTYTFTNYNYTYYLANASLDFYSLYYADYYGYLDFYGDVENQSASYVTYHTIVAMAAVDLTDTFVEDVDWNYVDGAIYDDSTSAIYPKTTQPFDITYQFALFNESDGKYMVGFEWDEVLADPDVEYPFGGFETPASYSTVASSVAVTGWALDDTGVESVKIYRESGGSLVYIGDALFVEGARPDIAAAYPDYPQNTRAGWGYMMLTNFLPNGGNGTFVLHAIATDVYGKFTDLGSKTIYCDNANAVKPFGAIDTPSSGGSASGNQFQNIGWALTPLPNMIPKNGSTIGVYVDGVKKGNGTYNLYREDIASLFPGYANSNGAMVSFKLNTLPYANGLHTIFWIATDNAGNADGIGSRYFTVSNTYSNTSGLKFRAAAFRPFKPIPALIASIPTDNNVPVQFKKGLPDTADRETPATMDINAPGITIHPLQRVVLHLPNLHDGFQVLDGKYNPLPIGSTLDTENGIFYWQPGPAFKGKFNLLFILKGPDGTLGKKNITIFINNEKSGDN